MTNNLKTTIKANSVTGSAIMPLLIEAVNIDQHCTGSRWSVQDQDALAKLVAIIAMGQATHAAQIIKSLSPAAPALKFESLKNDAKKKLSLSGESQDEIDSSRWRRDGLIFEAISWIAAQQESAGKALLKDPHLSSTTQGLDGLMIELDGSGSAIARAVIFEDKCSGTPRAMFRDEIIPAFLVYHQDQRSAELVAAAASLLEKSKLGGTDATIAAARILDKQFRSYRGSLALVDTDNSQNKRKAIFKGYEKLDEIGPEQRIGAGFISGPDLRQWFDDFANLVLEYINSLEGDETDV